MTLTPTPTVSSDMARASGSPRSEGRHRHRTIEHTAFVRRAYDDVCLILERHGDEVLSAATTAASQRSTALVAASEQEIHGYDPSEALLIETVSLARDHPNHAWLDFSWDANPTKRLLANVDTRLDIGPLIRSGPSQTTELTLRARYEPTAGSRRSPEAALFGRRVVKAALHRLLDSIVESIENYEESLFA